MSMPRPDWRHTAEHLGRDLDRFKAENEQLRAALKPFAEVAAMADADVPDDAVACALLGDFRRAADLCK